MAFRWRRLRPTAIAWLGAVAASLPAPGASAATNQTLWAQQVAQHVHSLPRALAVGRSLHLGVALEPRLLAAKLDDVGGFAVGAAVFAYATSFREAPSFGYALRLDNLSVDGSSSDEEVVGGSRRKIHGVRLGVDLAQAQGRYYFAERRAPALFAIGTAGLYASTLAWERAFGAAKTFGAWQLSAAAGVGAGRLLPITPRVALWHLERLLRQEGVLQAPLVEAVRAQLVAAWAARASDLGSNSRAIETMRILYGAQLLRGELSPSAAYRLERIIETWVSDPIMSRSQGKLVSLMLRSTRELVPGAAAQWRLAVELRGQLAITLSGTSEFWFEPGVAWAPRPQDSTGNLLPGLWHPLPLGPLVSGNALSPARARLGLPVHYERIWLDAFANPRGAISAQGGVDLAVGPRVQVGAQAGAAYTWFFSGTRGVKVGLTAAGALSPAGPQGQLQLVAAYVQGSGTVSYTAPIAAVANGIASPEVAGP